MESYNWKAKPISPCLGAHEAHPKTTLFGVVFQKLNGPLLTSDRNRRLGRKRRCDNGGVVADQIGSHRRQTIIVPVGAALSADAAAAGGVCTDVEMVRRGDGEAEQLIVVEYRHAERHVGTVRGATIGIVVHDHIAGTEHVAAGCEPSKKPGPPSKLTRSRANQNKNPATPRTNRHRACRCPCPWSQRRSEAEDDACKIAPRASGRGQERHRRC